MKKQIQFNKGGSSMNKKKILVISVAVCLVAILSMGTLAWFTAEDSVTNKFQIAESTTDPDKTFGIDVWETVDTDRDGTTEVVGKETKDDNAAFTQVLPGEIITKEPVITNTGVHPMYVRAIVTVSDADYLKSNVWSGEYAHMWWETDMFLAGTDADWKLDSVIMQDDEMILVYYYQKVLEAGGTTSEIFKDVVIPTNLTVDDAMAIQDFTVNVLGQAIQSEHLVGVTNANEAFAKYWDTAVAEDQVTDTPEAVESNGDAEAIVNKVVDGEPLYVMTEASEVAVINPTVSNTEAAIIIKDNVDNASIIMNGGNFTNVQKLVVAEGNGGLVVFLTAPITLNGVELTGAEVAALCENVLVLAYY